MSHDFNSIIREDESHDDITNRRIARLFYSASIGDAVLPYWIETDIFSYSVTDFSAPLLNAAVNVVVFPFLRGLPFNIIIFFAHIPASFLICFLQERQPFCNRPFFQYHQHLTLQAQVPRLPYSISVKPLNARLEYGHHQKQTYHLLHNKQSRRNLSLLYLYRPLQKKIIYQLRI